MTVTEIVTMCDNVPDFAVAVTVYGPGGSLSLGDNARVADAEPPADTNTLLGERFTLRRPVEAVADKDTFPLNPARLVTDIVDEADPPGATVRDEGFADIEKSPAVLTVRATTVEWDREPLVPVTVIE